MHDGNTWQITDDEAPPQVIIPEIIYVRREEIRAFHDQPRKEFEIQALKELGDSIRTETQLTPALARRLDPPIGRFKFELIDGERRWRACELKEIKWFLILINPRIQTKNDQYVQSVVANFFSVPLNDIECAEAIERFTKMGFKKETIGKRLGGKSLTWVIQHHSLLRLHPDVQKRMLPPTPKEERLPYMKALELVNFPHSLQLEMAEKIGKQKLSMTLTKGLVRKIAEKEGMTQRLRLPRKSFVQLRTLIRKSSEGVEDALDQSQTFFDKVIKGAKPEEIKLLLRNICDLQSSLGMLHEEITNRSQSATPS
jgi:ParB/RepB/Spo0J family partition protein